jgi:hypothetical protein
MPLGWRYDISVANHKAESRFVTSINTGDRGLARFNSPYSWIPSVFRVSDDGMDVHIESYINGLGPRDDFPVLYRLIEKLFLFALPHLERTINCPRNTIRHSSSGLLSFFLFLFFRWPLMDMIHQWNTGLKGHAYARPAREISGRRFWLTRSGKRCETQSSSRETSVQNVARESQHH